jgi:hypothetical protein
MLSLEDYHGCFTSPLVGEVATRKALWRVRGISHQAEDLFLKLGSYSHIPPSPTRGEVQQPCPPYQDLGTRPCPN